MESSFPEEGLQHVLSLIDSHEDRNSVSLVCKSWYEIERWCRRRVLIGNCYAVSPRILIGRFRNVRSITIKAKLHQADYDELPEGWGGHALPWIAELAAAYPASLEEISFKRMVVTDEGLELIGKAFRNLRGVVLCRCQGFSTLGLASLASTSRKLRTLDLVESEVDDLGGNWISHFPDSYTSLEFLNVENLKHELPFSSLDRLVARCPNLYALRLNHSFPLDKLLSLLVKAPRLVDLGIGSFTPLPCPNSISIASSTFERCRGIKILSGLWDVHSHHIPAIYPLCSGITFLNLGYATTLRCPDLVKLLQHCPNLQRLWVLDNIEDLGLEELARSCKDLQELRLILSDPLETDSNNNLTEKGLVSVAKGCPKLHYIRYLCNQMTNAALIIVAKSRPNLTHFRLGILEPQLPDHLTDEPLDDGFGAIVESCNNLKRLSVTGLVTDRLLRLIGIHAKKLKTLFLSFAGNSDAGLHHILSGCGNLRKLEIRDCPFGDRALLSNAGKLETMRFLWMSRCHVSYRACKQLAKKLPRLNVEVMNDRGPMISTSDESFVENLYVYRTVVGPRLDMPSFVSNTGQKESLGESGAY